MINYDVAGSVGMEGGSHRAGSYLLQDPSDPPLLGTAVSLDGDYVVQYDGSAPILGVLKALNGKMCTVTEIGFCIRARATGSIPTAGTLCSFNDSGVVTAGSDFLSVSPKYTGWYQEDSDTGDIVQISFISTGSGIVGGSSEAQNTPVVQAKATSSTPRTFSQPGGEK